MENRPVVTVEVSVRPSDAYSPFTWTSQNLVRLVAVVIVGAFFYDVYQSRPAGNAAESLLALFWSVMLMLCVVLALFGIPYLRLILLFRSTPSFKKPKQFSFTSEGMHFQSVDASGDYKWSAFLKIVETRKAFLFTQTARSATIVPKRCFSSSGDVQMLRELVCSNFKGKFRLRRD